MTASPAPAPSALAPTALIRGMGLRTVVSTSTGLAFAAIEYLAVAGLLTVVAGRLAWLAVVVAGGLVLAAWGFYGELNGLFPTAAAIRLWMSKSMDDRLALTVTFSYMSTIILVLAADAYIVGSAVAHVLGQPSWLTTLYIGGLLVVAAAVNLQGVALAGRVQDIATYAVIAATAVVAGIAVVHAPTHAGLVADAARGHGPADFVKAVALGILLYSAFEWVTTNAEEVREPGLIPRGMLIALGLLGVTCALLSFGMGRLLSAHELASAYPQLYLGERAAGQAGLVVMCVVTAVTALNTFNGGFITASRFVYATAREGALPPVFARLNSAAVPWVPVVVLAGTSLVTAVVVSITGSWQAILATGAALESVIYAVAGYCVLVLRRRLPDADRPFRLRFGTPLAVAGIVVFGLLALIASVSVGDHVSITPLLIMVAVTAVSLLYVRIGLPKVRAAEAARQAARQPRRRRPTEEVSRAVEP